MGLLSGYLVVKFYIQKKRSPNPLNTGDNEGEAVTNFEGHTIAELKKMRSLVDTKTLEYDESMKILLFAESKMAFHLNNQIVRSVRGVNLCHWYILLVEISVRLLFF